MCTGNCDICKGNCLEALRARSGNSQGYVSQAGGDSGSTTAMYKTQVMYGTQFLYN